MDVGYHTLSDFRSQQAKVIDGLITQVLGLLMQQDLVDLSRVAQDGTRVRASAGASSFRREQTLAALMTRRASTGGGHARGDRPCHLHASGRGALARRSRAPGPAGGGPATSARGNRNEEAQRRQGRHGPCVHHRPGGAGHEDGRRGFRPAFNIQFATTADKARVIVGVDVSNRGSDMGQTTPMLDQIEKRTGVRPDERCSSTADTHSTMRSIMPSNMAQRSTRRCPSRARGDNRDPHVPREGDSAAVGAWRKRMATDEAKTIYKQRAATAETVNADASNIAGSTASPFAVGRRSWVAHISCTHLQYSPSALHRQQLTPRPDCSRRLSIGSQRHLPRATARKAAILGFSPPVCYSPAATTARQ